MAKIDITAIEGYSEMTPEEKVAALEAVELPDPDYSGYVKKEVHDKTASEAADWKKKYKGLLSEEDQKKQAALEELEGLRDTVKTLTQEKTLAQYKSELVAQGYEEALADETAQAMLDGDMAKVFANNKKFLEQYAKSVRANTVKGTPRPASGGQQPVDYSKQIEEAQANGNQMAAAYYMRLQEEAKMKT